MYTSEFRQRLKKVKRNGKGWTALCPAHDDRNPSLSISEKGGKILVHCHAGCTPEAVCAALGIKLSDLFAENNSHSTVETTYDYTDEKGELLFQVVRYFGKKFSQRRPDGHGGWINNLKGTSLGACSTACPICPRLPPSSSSKAKRMSRRHGD